MSKVMPETQVAILVGAAVAFTLDNYDEFVLQGEMGEIAEFKKYYETILHQTVEYLETREMLDNVMTKAAKILLNMGYGKDAK